MALSRSAVGLAQPSGRAFARAFARAIASISASILALAPVAVSTPGFAAGPDGDPALVRRHAPVQANPFSGIFPCPEPGGCGVQAGPGPADRAVRPFRGTLGRPCAYRRRATPDGTRRIRVCF